MSSDLTHFDQDGNAIMVDVSAKDSTERIAIAVGAIVMQPETIRLIQQGVMKKGDVLSVAQLAGIMGAKRTPEIIPLCHPLPLDSAKVEITSHDARTLLVTATARTTGKTGVEMEALTGASTAALTLYDMCKSANPAIVISELKLQTKTGGKSDYSLQGKS